MVEKFKPLLSATLEEKDFDKLDFPVYVSPKLDGIRALILKGQAVTRSLKPVRNKQIQNILGKSTFEGLDGEIIVGSPEDKLAFRKTTTGVMAEDGETDFCFYVFDDFTNSGKFMHRYHRLIERVATLSHPRIKVVIHPQALSLKDLLHWESKYLELGFEGIMIRSLYGEYKLGRSTLNQGILLKLKRFADSEAVIVGFVERLKNMNEQTRDELGYAERSSHKENMFPEGTLGAFRVKSEIFKEYFTIGSGLTDEERQHIWDNQEKYLGQTLKFKYFNYGNYDRPRFPTYQGIRYLEDQL